MIPVCKIAQEKSTTTDPCITNRSESTTIGPARQRNRAPCHAQTATRPAPIATLFKESDDKHTFKQ